MRSLHFRHTYNRCQSANRRCRTTLFLLALLLSIWAQPIVAESTLRATSQNSWLAYQGKWDRTGAVNAAEPKTKLIEHHHRPNVANHP